MATKLRPTIQYGSNTYVLLDASLGYNCDPQAKLNDNHVKMYYPLDDLCIVLVETTDDDPAAKRTYRFKPAFREFGWSGKWRRISSVTIDVNMAYGEPRARKLLSKWAELHDKGDSSYSAYIRNIEFPSVVLAHPAMHDRFDAAIAAHQTKLLHELSDKFAGLTHMKDALDKRVKKNAEPFR